MDSHRDNRSCASDLVTSSASSLAIFAPFLGLGASGGVASQRLFPAVGWQGKLYMTFVPIAFGQICSFLYDAETRDETKRA